MSPATAKKLGLAKTDDWSRSSSAPAPITASVLVLPGHADDSVTIALGYGRNPAPK